MDDHAKFERMLRMLLLLSNGRNYSISELAERFEMSPRSTSRYIATFRKAGFIVDCRNAGYSIRRMEKPFKELHDLLHFSEEEAFILKRAIHSIDDTNILKTNLVKKLYALYDQDKLVDTVVNSDHSGNVHHLIHAIREKKQVILQQYRSAHSNLVRDRLVEPFDFTTNYIAIWAFEPETRSCKLFKTVRIGNVKVLEKQDQFESLHQKEPEDVFRISSDRHDHVKLRLSLRACNLLLEEYPLAEQYTTAADDNYWHFEGEVCGFEGVGRFVLGLGNEVQVLESEEFRRFLRERITILTKSF